jgi:hypothetical protein
MIFNIGIQHGGLALFVVGTGAAQICDMLSLIDAAATVSRIKGYRCVSIDLLAATPMLDTREHEQLGAHAANVLRHVGKVAVIVSIDHPDRTACETAKREGLNIEVFTDLHVADTWLSSGA